MTSSARTALRPSAALRAVRAGERTDPVLSVELLPPRPAARDGFARAVDHLARAGLDFVSVTYGAAGSATGASLATVREVAEVAAAAGASSLGVVAHLTCIGHGPDELVTIAGELLDAGATAFLALRGDPPSEPGWSAPPDVLASSAELVELLHGVAAERGVDVDVAVAAFPGGHPASTGPGQDLAALRAKADAGADFGLTQLVFDAREYASLLARADAAGIELPLVPGVLPLTDPARVVRVATLAGVEPSADVLAALEARSGSSPQERADRHRIGVELTARLARELLEAGAPGLHLYSMNRHEAVVDVLDALDLLPVPACSCPGGRS